MNYEIEFLPVGTAAKAGDAIVIRYGNEADFKLMLVDGGHLETGDEIISHLTRYYGPSPVLEHVVLTHSDGDHASGLRTVLEKMIVRNLWLHIPWEYTKHALHLFSEKNSTEAELENAIRNEYPIIEQLVEAAEKQGCNVEYPFAGTRIGPFIVASPSLYRYCHLLPQFEKTPAPNREAIAASYLWLEKERGLQKVLEAFRASEERWTRETWDEELLRNGGKTAPSNESSVVLYGDLALPGRRKLLTGDAGINALYWAADFIEAQGHPLRSFDFVQVPHHGSRRNVGPDVLDRLIGPPLPFGTKSWFNAFVSAPKDDAKHPRRIVLNAFTRRGGAVSATQGNRIVHWGGFLPRSGYGAASVLELYSQVEEYS